jgi:dTDP-4-amino-4,6-dideoxygalactose transaminase
MNEEIIIDDSSRGEIATVSFYANKQITTGEGDMILTNDKGLAIAARAKA